MNGTFTARHRPAALLLAAATAVSLAACSSAGPGGTSGSPAPTGSGGNSGSPSSSMSSGSPSSSAGSAAVSKGPGGVQEITIEATDQLRFSPSTIRVHVGTLRVTLMDSGSYPHDLVVPKLHHTSATVTGDPGGQRTVTTLRFTSPGTYPFDCMYHATAGMRGVFIVTG